jgi:hypothetical protein
MIDSLDREARRPGVIRQSIIKLWIAERLEHCRSGGAAGNFRILVLVGAIGFEPMTPRS